ncbi:hypothetical protein REPUB_Repub17cG0056300 [Reevesia pubescens]
MNSSSPLPNPPPRSPPQSSTSTIAVDGSRKKVRKPFTITKSRKSWTEEEHDKFLEALQLFVCFVSTPKILEKFVTIEREILKIERLVQANELNANVDGKQEISKAISSEL